MKDPHITYDGVRAQQREAFHRELNNTLQQHFGLVDAQLILGRNTQGPVWELCVYVETVLNTWRVQLDPMTGPYSAEAKRRVVNSVALIAAPLEEPSKAELRERITAVFHELWGQSADGIYDKALWSQLQSLLSELGTG